MAAVLAAFERQRLANIARNQEVMRQQLAGVDTSLLQQPAKPVRAPKPRAPRAPKGSDPARRSGRNEGKERPDYASQQNLVVYVEHAPRQPKLRLSNGSRGGGRTGVTEFPAWHPGIPAPPSSAQQRAFDEAEELARQLNKQKRPAFVKPLGPSMVSSGFWLQAPSQLLQHLQPDSDVTFTCSDPTRPQESFRHTQARRRDGALREDAWTVGLLLKKTKEGQSKGGIGFSKNWRGFAIDQFIHPEDIVVFEVTGTQAVQVHLFRAWDHATSQPPDLQQLRFSHADGGASAAAAAAGPKRARKRAAAGDSEQADEGGSEDGAAGGASVSASVSDSEGGSPQQQQQQQQQQQAAGSKARRAKGSGAQAAPAAKRRKAAAAGAGSGSSRAGGKLSRAGSSTAADVDAPAAAAAGSGGRGKPAQQKQRKPRKQADAKADAKVAAQAAEQEGVFIVDHIVNSMLKDGVRLYKVRWYGYGPEDDTYEPAQSFDKPLRQYRWKTAIPADVP